MTTASVAAEAGDIVYTVSLLPILYIDNHVSANAKFGMSLVPNLAMGIGWKTFARFESTGVLSLVFTA